MEGQKTEKLTATETRRLEREQKKIAIEKRVVKADGTVTPREKRFLRREQNRSSRHITRQKKYTQTR